VGLANLGSESETCVGSCVRLVGVLISFEKNFYRLPFTPPPSGSPYWSFTLPLALAVGHVDSWSPEDEEDVLHRREATGVSVTTILLSLALLRGGAALVLLEHVALLEGVVDRCLVVWAGLL
jgi:hypothetical protein